MSPPDHAVRVEQVAPVVTHDLRGRVLRPDAPPDRVRWAADDLPGTAAFAGFGIPVAGKSGTAESGGPDPHAWFPAYAPADDPTISVATVLPNIPLGTGGSDAAPLVRRVMAVHFSN